MLAGCAAKPSRPDGGAVEKGTYSNPYFGLSLTLPSDWSAEVKPKAVDRFLAYYLKLLTARDKEEPEGRVFFLLQTGRLPVKLMGQADAVVTIGAAFVGDKPGMDARRAMGLARVMVKDPPAPMKEVASPPQATFGGVNFAALRFVAGLKDSEVHEAVYVTIRQSHALVITVAGRNAQSLKAADAVLQSIKFSAPS